MNATRPDPLWVTRPSLAPLDEVRAILESAWESGILTHNGPLVQRFESACMERFGLDNLVAVTNGTIALQIALRALGVTSGEVIVPAFTWVATLSAIKWEGATPVVVDVLPDTLNIDPEAVRAAITSKTRAIMPVHVFGQPVDIAAIERIASEHGLTVIYDAAHAVGSRYGGRSALSWGDVSATSFHATKLLNTGEGGGCIARDEELAERLREIRFFGHDRQKNIVRDGLNGKMTEIHAALGLANLVYLDEVLDQRRRLYAHYRRTLEPTGAVRFQTVDEDQYNASYFPVLFVSEEVLLHVLARLEREQIYPRRYFYPSVNTLGNIVNYRPAPVSEDVSRRILCLPLYFGLSEADVDRVCGVVSDAVVAVRG